jgi:hypothetical protein
MNSLTKILIGTGMVLTGGYLFRMSRTSANLEIEANSEILSLKVSGLTVRINAKIKNPTDGTLKIKYPFLKLIFKGETLGSSQVIDKDITIPKFGEVNIEGIIINIPLTGIFSIAMDLLKALKTNEGVKVSVKVITTIYTTFSTLPYETEIEQVLRASKTSK